jgi:hypothetical protein
MQKSYMTRGKENIAANSLSLGCVGNVILDIHIDNGEKLKIDALVVSHLSCMERYAKSWTNFA